VNNVVLYDALFDVENPNQALMTQMTAQVFFVAASTRNAVLVPVAALRPAPREGGGKRAGGERKDERKSGAGGERKGGMGGRPAGNDPRAQFANGAARVSVVGADGKAVDRDVSVGVMNRVSAEILSGLEPGEKVVIGTKPPAGAARTPAASTLLPTVTKGGGRP
jgi:macrolide-specific efflux system membrane fusion protein